MFKNKNNIPFIYGNDCVVKNSNIINKLGSRCLIITGANSAKTSGALDDVETALKNEKIEYVIFNKVKQNPFVSDCYNAGKLAREFDADFLIGIGGGSPQDSTKAISVFATNEDLTEETIYNLDYKNKGLPFILIGTTAGTGSEATAISVLTIDDIHMKKSVKSDDFYADLVFVDEKYTYSLPIDFTISTALDAFSHSVEAYMSPKANEVVYENGQKLLPILWNALKKLNSGVEVDKNMRKELLFSSIYAGMEIDVCGTAFPHAFSYVLTESFNIPHGKACTTFLPSLVEHTLRINEKLVCEVLSLCGCDFNEFKLVIDSLTANKVKMSDEQISMFSDRFENCKNFENVQGGFSKELCKELFTKLFK